MLTKMLQESGSINDLPKPEREILYKLAAAFQDNTHCLFLNPEELVEFTGLGTKEQWTKLLNLQETKNFIKAQMAFIAEISQRKTFRSLVQMALDGNQQAAKQVQELSGIMNQRDSNRIVVLHRIPRPKEE